jgi:hypothetical protein
MSHLHTEEQEQTSMDATSTIRATVCAAAMIITLQSCTQQQPEAPAPQHEPIEFNGYDMTDNAGKAVQNLEIFLQSVTTTTTTAMQQNRNTATPTPQHSSVWDDLAQCETGGDWATNTGNGFGGGLQFAHQQSWSTWRAFHGEQYAPHPWEATREQQIEVAERVLKSSGWGAWPGCARKLGLR